LKFIEVDLIGVYVAPIALLIIATWFATKQLHASGVGKVFTVIAKSPVLDIRARTLT
jgi:hypothetical protein